MTNLKTNISRIIYTILFIVYIFYRITGYYFDSAPMLVHKTPYGFLALIQYETCNYKKASLAWRRHFNLYYTSVQIAEQKKYLSDKIAKDPSNANNHIWLADLLFVQGEYQKASECLEKALEKNHDIPIARIGLASCYMALDEDKKAETAIEDLFRSGFNTQDIIPGYLNFLVAFDKYLNTPGASENHPVLTTNAYRFLYYFDKRKDKMVLEYADKAIEKQIEPDKAHFAKASIFKNQEKYEESLKEYNNAITINPRKSDYYARASFVCGKIGRISEELNYLRKASELETEYPEFSFQLGKVLMDKYGDVLQAIPYLKKSFEMEPDDISYASNYGIALKQIRHFEEAIKVANIMISNDREDRWGYIVKAGVYLEMGKDNDALVLYKRILEIDPTDFNSTKNTGFLLEKIGRHDEAINIYERAKYLKPYDVNTLYVLQYLYRRKGRYHDAMEALKEILRIQPDHSDAQALLSYVERNLNK